MDRRLVDFARVPRFAIFTTLAQRLPVGVDFGYAGVIGQDQSSLGFESPRGRARLLPEIPSDRLLIAAELSIGSPRSAEFSKGGWDSMRSVICNRPAARRASCRPEFWAVCLTVALLAAPAVARDDDPRAKANTSRAAREEALRALPLARLDRDARAKAAAVIKNLSIYRRLPVQTIDCDPELYAFLMRNPEVVVNLWQVMGITRMQLDRLDPTHYKVADGEGTKGQMEYMFTSGNVNVIYSEGTYDGPLYPRTVRGKCLMLLRSEYRRAANGRYSIVTQLDTFLAVDNLGVEVLAKTFQPLIGKAADHNFTETATFVSNLSRTAETNEDGLLRLGRKLNRVDATTRDRFLELITAVPQKLAMAEN